MPNMPIMSSGGLPTRPTRPGLGAPKARGPPRFAGQVAIQGWCPQSLEVLKDRAPRIGGPHGLGVPKGWGPPWVGGRKRVSGCVYETKPIIAVICFGFVSFKECSLKAVLSSYPQLKKGTPLFGDPLDLQGPQGSGAPKAQKQQSWGVPKARQLRILGVG
jgi:hypothetical protein